MNWSSACRSTRPATRAHKRPLYARMGRGGRGKIGERVAVALRDERLTSHLAETVWAEKSRPVGRTTHPHATRCLPGTCRPRGRGDHPAR